jgi:hypothetical protein
MALKSLKKEMLYYAPLTKLLMTKKIKNKPETIFEQEYRLKQEAKILAEKHKDKKPVKYLLK